MEEGVMALTSTTPDRVAERVGRRPNWLWVGVGSAAFVVIALVITALRPAPRFPFVPNESGMAQMPSPETAPYLTGNHIGATIVMTLIGLMGVGLGIRMSIKGKTLLPVMVGLSGVMIAIPEVFYDVIGAVYFPFSHTEPLGWAYEILGRPMPVWILAGWFGYGVFAVFTYWVLTVRPTTRVLWYMWGAAAVGATVFEELLLKTDVYHYYGNQPLVLISELPWWWTPCNSVGTMLAAAIAYRFRSSLRGAGALCMLVVTPMSVTAIYGFIALPSWIATNADYPWLITQVLGLITIVLGVFAYMGVLKLVLNRDPFDLDYKPSEEEEFLRVR
jgi:hypothetical protein